MSEQSSDISERKVVNQIFASKTKTSGSSQTYWYVVWPCGRQSHSELYNRDECLKKWALHHDNSTPGFSLSQSQRITPRNRRRKQLNYSTLKTLTIEDLTTRIASINPDTLSTDWMKLNNASAYITAAPTDTASLTAGTNTNGGLILFDSPVDESTVETKVLTVTGRVLSPSVSRVVINGTPATIDPAKQTFSLGAVPLTAKENNIVYRTFDVSGGLLSKGVVTVYTTAPGLAAGTTAGASTRAQVETYKPDNRFKIIAPSADFYETRETKVKIEGRVTANVAHHITINDFKLNSFQSTEHHGITLPINNLVTCRKASIPTLFVTSMLRIMRSINNSSW
jgi:hypothetical protein